MRSTLYALILGLLLSAGTGLLACSSNDPIPDDGAQPMEYDSLQESDNQDEPYDDYQDEPGTMGAPGAMGEPAQIPRATGTVATVNGTEITAERYNEQMDQEIAVLQQQFGQVPPEFLQQIQQQLIDHLIQQQLLFNAIEEADVEVSQGEIDERVEQFREDLAQSPQMQMQPEMTLEDVLAQEGMSMDDFREILEKEIAMEALLAERGITSPSDDEVRQYYDDHPEEFTEPEMVDAEYLFFPITGGDDAQWAEAREEIEALRQQVIDGEMTFQELVDQEQGQLVSQEAPVFRDQPQQPEGVEEAAFDELADGEISQPIRTPHGWILVRRIEHIDESMVDFDEVEHQLSQHLYAQAMGEGVETLLQELRDQATIELFPENIQ